MSDLQVFVGGLRSSEKGGKKTHTFNAYVQFNKDFSFLVAGVRVMNGRLCPPMKFNNLTKRFSNTFFTNEGLAAAIYDAVQIQLPQVELVEKKKSIWSLSYDKKRMNQWLPEHFKQSEEVVENKEEE